jgi:hypothetical protein
VPGSRLVRERGRKYCFAEQKLLNITDHGAELEARPCLYQIGGLRSIQLALKLI